ncbi:MAG: nucleotidyltransferase family protein [Desulforhopalus sp.]|nr:nucleotidyltransferase family protein [Desulforhopalus sp.]
MITHDCYKLQRLALLPTADSPPIEELHSALQKLSEDGQQQLLSLIQHQGLQFFWLEALRSLPGLPFTSAWRERLKEQCFSTTARYLAQKKSLIELDDLFFQAGIPYATFKGAHTREILYGNPVFRPSADIDILVAPGERFKAIQNLCAIGYTLQANIANVSNEVTLVKGNVHLDLHWHIMRPGRPRIDMTNLFLQSRKRCDFFWALDNDTTLLVLLTHPVFTEYSMGPGSSLVKLADLGRWIAKEEIDWYRLQHLLEKSGMKTASWITATLLANLSPWCLPSSVYKAITPQQPKKSILEAWVKLNLSAKLIHYPGISKYVFTLLAHDRLQDIMRFIRIYLADRRNSKSQMEQLIRASSCQ